MLELSASVTSFISSCAATAGGGVGRASRLHGRLGLKGTQSRAWLWPRSLALARSSQAVVRADTRSFRVGCVDNALKGQLHVCRQQACNAQPSATAVVVVTWMYCKMA